MKTATGYGITALALAAATAAQAQNQPQTQVQERPKLHGHARAHTDTQRLDRLEAALRAQAAQIAAQAALLEQQRQQLEAQDAKLRSVEQTSLAAERAPIGPPADNAPIARHEPGLPAPVSVTADISQAPNGGPALVTPVTPQNTPVGETPPPAQKVEIAALPQETSVLTPRGGWYVEPSFEYTRSSANVLVFNGVEIATGIQIGILEANNAARDTLVGMLDVRYGLTNRLELEAIVPYVSRMDRVQTVAQRDESVTDSESLTGRDLGDVEFGLRYQINDAKPDQPIFIGGLRYKSATGSNPYELTYDQFGTATSLATGSGFQAIEPSLSMLLPTDPAVIFASVSYIHNFGYNVNRDIGGAHVGDVTPGDSIGVTAGFGFAINPRFSFSLGYKQNYIYPTYTELNDTRQRSNVLEVGAFTFGWSYSLTPRIAIASTFEFGVTSDAPDLNLILRLPIRF